MTALQHARHIILRGVPKTATTWDVRRVLTRSGAHGVTNIHICYEYFKPTGEVLITLSRPHFLRDNLRVLDNVSFAASRVSPRPFIPEEAPRPKMRSRGLRGKEQAALRGALNGNGPHAGMSNLDRTVTIWGLAGKATPRALAEVLEGFDVAESAKGRMNIIKIPLPENQFSMTSRFIVTLKTVAEAHRVVRALHQTRHEQLGTHPIKAASLY